MDVVKPDRLLVPTAVSTAAPPTFPASFEVDHFKCYKVSKVKLRAYDVTLEDRFGLRTVDVKKPTRLCLAADKNGEGIPDLTQSLMCYAFARARGTPIPTLPSLVQTIDQFGPDAYALSNPTDLCVPAEVFVP